MRRSRWPVLLLGLLAVSAPSAALAQRFSFSPPADEAAGTKASAAVLQDFALDNGKALHQANATFTRVTQATEGTAVLSSWRSNIGNILVQCRSEKTAAGFTFQTTITNGYTHRIESLDIQLPQVHTRSDRDNRMLSPFRGGQMNPWADDWAKGQGNSSLWPATAFSPIVTAWNQRTGESLGITFFSKSLTPAMLFWFSGPSNDQQHLNPFVRYHPGLQPGQSITLTAEYRLFAGGPAAHQKQYREEVLAPFMKEIGIPEAAGGIEPGPIALSHWVERGRLRDNLRAALAAGAQTYIQWSPPDASSHFFNPYVAQLPWFQELAVGKEFPGMRLGVLINPFITPPLKSDAFALKAKEPYTNLRLNFSAPANREYFARLRDELVARGVSVAFWDTGGNPEHIHGHEWLKFLANWKTAGIAILPETSCDVAAWTTGIWMEYPYSWGTYEIARTVCPEATLTAHTNTPDVRNGVDWRQDALGKGVRPIVEMSQLLRPAAGRSAQTRPRGR